MIGFNLWTGEYMGCSASNVDEITLDTFVNTVTGEEYYAVTILIDGERYAVAESVSPDASVALQLYHYLVIRTEELQDRED